MAKTSILFSCICFILLRSDKIFAAGKQMEIERFVMQFQASHVTESYE